MTTLSSVEITTRRRSAKTLGYLLATAVVLLSLLFFYWQTIGRGAGRLFDFNIAYCASGVWLQGGNPFSRGDVLRHWEVIGGAHDLGSIAHLWVVHAPATFAVISPFTLLSPGHANTAWLIFSLVAMAALLATACKAAGLKLGSAASLWVVAFALVCTPVQLAVYHGQPALPSIACCMAAYLASLSGRQRTTGVLLAIAMCIKPHIALPVLLFIAMRRQWIGVLYTIVLFGLVSAFAGVWMADHGHIAWFANWQSNLFAATHNGDTNDYTFGNGIRFDLVQLHVPWFGILRSRAATELAVIATTLALGASYLWLRHRMKEQDDLLDFSALSLLCLLPFYHRWPDAAVIVPAIAWTVGKTARSKAPVVPLLALGVFVVPIAVFGSGAMKLVLMLPTAEMAERVFRILIEPFQTWSVVILLVALLAAMHNAGQGECSQDAAQAPTGLGPRP